MSRSDSPGRTHPPEYELDAAERRGRPWWIVPIASGLVVAVIIASVIFVLTRASVAGKWYGPGNIEGTTAPVALAAYMELSQQITGSLSGSGQLCMQTASGVAQTLFTITGNTSGSSVKLTLQLSAASAGPTGIPLAKTLNLHGTLSDGGLTLSGFSPPGLLALQKGDQTDYDETCINLPPVTAGDAS
jgi:hypothetical protein